MNIENIIEILEEENRENQIMLRDISEETTKQDIDKYRRKFQINRDTIEQLKYRVAGKPKNVQYWEKVGAIGRCPQCDVNVNWELGFCGICGKKLDWSKVGKSKKNNAK